MTAIYLKSKTVKIQLKHLQAAAYTKKTNPQLPCAALVILLRKPNPNQIKPKQTTQNQQTQATKALQYYWVIC